MSTGTNQKRRGGSSSTSSDSSRKWPLSWNARRVFLSRPPAERVFRQGQPPQGDNRRQSMQLTEKHREYWRKNLTITAILLVVWFIVTFVEGWYARELNNYTFLGFPLGFYMSAQGSLIVYVVLIGIYARYMNNLDRVYDVHEGEDE